MWYFWAILDGKKMSERKSIKTVGPNGKTLFKTVGGEYSHVVMEADLRPKKTVGGKNGNT